jgi:hypothetical protein
VNLSEGNNSKLDFNNLSKKFDTSQNESQTEKDDENTSSSILKPLKSVIKIIRIVSNSFKQHLHVTLAKIHVKVATQDAAQTALLYGAVSTAVACIVELIDDITNLKPLKSSSISVEPDFLLEKTDIRLKIILYISVLGAIKIFMKSFFKYFSLNDKTQINNRKEKQNG